MTMRISTERTIRVYDDDHGFFFQVGADRDGLGLCEIGYSEGGPTIEKEISMGWPHAVAVAKAIIELAERQP